ncbi:MAG TPA: TlpA disulfide reductase family protein [Alphaproteobacteria bacterium]|nr:TlpA disulfide reductase family protein [Alphaproteobacteria bacterium]
MNKQKLFSYLSILGVIFSVVVVFQYTQMYKNRGEVIADQVEVPDDFARDFARVITKNRSKPIEEVHFLSPEGEKIDWSAFKGEYLLVNFWASWCSPCVIELPTLDRLEQKFRGKGLKVIAISLDQGRSHDEIKEYLYNRNLGEFAAYFDSDTQVQKTIPMRGIPTTYMLDKRGNVLHVFEGDADWDSPESIAFFNKFLDNKD